MPPCPTCGFAADAPPDELVRTVRAAEVTYRRLLVHLAPAAITTPPADGGWSPVASLWHVVDVLRLGADRLLALVLDPDVPIVPWDADELAAARRYEALGVHTGLHALGGAARAWEDAYATCDPRAVAHHPEIGPMTRDVLAAYNAHEVVHHAHDIARRTAA